MIHRFIYFEHMGFADIASCDYLLIDGEEYSIRWEKDEYFEYRGDGRNIPYIRGIFFRLYNSDHEEMRIELGERKELDAIMEMTQQIKWHKL